jgi:hypothetical protein
MVKEPAYLMTTRKKRERKGACMLKVTLLPPTVSHLLRVPNLRNIAIAKFIYNKTSPYMSLQILSVSY